MRIDLLKNCLFDKPAQGMAYNEMCFLNFRSVSRRHSENLIAQVNNFTTAVTRKTYAKNVSRLCFLERRQNII